MKVSDRAMSTTCPVCHKAIKVEDVTVKSYVPVNDLQTCGSVHVTRRGRVAARTIQVGAGLECEGTIEASIECAGEVSIGPKATWKGPMLRARVLHLRDGASLDGYVDVGLGNPGVPDDDDAFDAFAEVTEDLPPVPGRTMKKTRPAPSAKPLRERPAPLPIRDDDLDLLDDESVASAPVPSVTSRTPAARKPVVKKAVTKKTAAKKPVVKKATTKKATAKKPVARKAATKKTTAKKPAVKKAATKKTTAKKPAVKKAATKKTTAKKPAAKKAATKKTTAKKPAAKKAATKKTTAKKPAAKKAATKKTTAKKPVAKKTASKKKPATKKKTSAKKKTRRK